ncbi:hypothetical protein EOW77_0028145 [Bradyrhizobium yuanmingense]|uniref:hypothetical protein n=1 Tax=Bradyrhizobium yuanmingense TaxID=108015 RepID=UPI000FE3CBF9|nr:hypothetical protein [Bradyrhizobium yuanmingense]TGN80497.1 hypothetical protein EOW77_0028145 [Bradyrhizobium yuanmingense]
MAERGEPDRKAEPGSLLSQWWTMLSAQYDPRIKPRHVSVMLVIIQAFRRDFGNGRASISYIKRTTRMDERTIIKTCRELADWGFVTRHVVSGRVTEYVPAWATTKPYPTNTSGDLATSENTSGFFAGGTPGILARGSAQTSPIFPTESYLPSPAYSPADGISKSVSASGPDAEAPAVAGGFESIWLAYGRYGNKQASRQAFKDITNPDVDHIASRAASWAASAKPGQRRMPLEKWLEQERYDEADRSMKARVAPTSTAGDGDDEEPDVRKKHATDYAEIAEAERRLRQSALQYDVPPGVLVTIIDTVMIAAGNDLWLQVETDRGSVAVLLEAQSASLQEAGQEHFGRLCDACGVSEVNNSSDLHGKSFMIVRGTFADLPDEQAA